MENEFKYGIILFEGNGTVLNPKPSYSPIPIKRKTWYEIVDWYSHTTFIDHNEKTITNQRYLIRTEKEVYENWEKEEDVNKKWQILTDFLCGATIEM